MIFVIEKFLSLIDMILEIWNMFLSALDNFLQLELIFKMLAVYNVLKLLYVVLMECHGVLRFFYVYFDFLDWFLQRLSLLLLVNILLWKIILNDNRILSSWKVCCVNEILQKRSFIDLLNWFSVLNFQSIRWVNTLWKQ